MIFLKCDDSEPENNILIKRVYRENKAGLNVLMYLTILE